MTETSTPAGETIVRELETAVRHTAVYGIGNIVVKAMGFFMIPFYTRYLSPKDYGILEVTDLTMSLVALILNMGMTPAFLRCYAAAGTTEAKKEVVSSGCTFGIVTGLLIFFLGVGLIPRASVLLFGPSIPASYLLLSFVALVLNYMANLPRTYLRALEAAGTYTLVDTGGVCALLSLNIIFIAVLKLGLAGILWSSAIVAAVQCMALASWATWRAGIRFDRVALRKMLGFGVPLMFSNGGLFILNFADRFFLQRLCSLEVVGIYAVGYKVGFMMNYLVVQPFFVMWQSRMYVIHAQPEHPRIFRELFALYSSGLIYVGLAMAIVTPDLVRPMVGAQFASMASLIPLIVLSYVFYGIGYYVQLGMFLKSKTRVIGWIGVLGAGLNLVLNYCLIARYAMMGAAWATLLSFAFITGVSYWRSQKVCRLRLGMGRLAMTLLLAVAVYGACRLCNPNALGSAVAVKVLGIIAFPVLLWKTGILLPSAASVMAVASIRVMNRVVQASVVLYRRIAV